MSESSNYIADFLKILADKTRLEILELLKNSERSSDEIQEHLEKSQPTVSQHLKILTDANLISNEKKGNKKFYCIKHQYVFKILTFVRSFVFTLEKEKAKKLNDLDRFDTLGV